MDRLKSYAHLAKRGMAKCLSITICLLSLWTCPAMFANEPASAWEGLWETRWQGSASMIELKQNGQQLEGSLIPFDATILGTLNQAQRFSGTWQSPTASGQIHLTLSQDQQSFFGHIDQANWITGQKSPKNTNSLTVSYQTPRQTLSTFIEAGNEFNNGEVFALKPLFESIQLPNSLTDKGYRTRIEHIQEYFDLLSLTTIRLFTIENEIDANIVSHNMPIEGTDLSIPIQIKFIDQQWKVVIPERNDLNQLREGIFAGLGIHEIAPQEFLKLNSPRASIKSFIKGFEYWNEWGEDAIISTMNLGEINPNVRHWDAPLLAFYLKNIFERISPITWQEISNNPNHTVPFVLFKHPKGNIELSAYPIETEHGVSLKWQFTPETLDSLRGIYDALEPAPKTYQIKSEASQPFFFSMRDYINQLPALLFFEVAGVELWQWLGLTLVVLIALQISLYARVFLNQMLQRFLSFTQYTPEKINLIFGIPSIFLLVGIILSYGLFIFGIPDDMASFIRHISHLSFLLSLYWFLFSGTNEIIKFLMRLAEQNENILDDILLSILNSVTKIIIVILAIYHIAESLGAPTETIIAALGIIGVGFAFAARDLISNFFGSAIILVDRPFKPGDIIGIDQQYGQIKRVGLRSTRVQCEDDSELVIPNSVVSQAQVVNLSERTERFAEMHFDLETGSDTQSLEQAQIEIKDFLESAPEIGPGFKTITIEETLPGRIKLICRFYSSILDRQTFHEFRTTSYFKLLSILDNNNLSLARANDFNV